MKRVFSLIVVLCLLFGCAAYAITLPKAPDGYIYDKAGVISELTKEVIALNNQELAKACGAEIFIVTVRDTGDYGSADYAYMLMNDWGVGDKKKDNGAMFLLALRGGDDNGYALVTGSGTEKYITAEDADMLLTDYFDNYYLIGDYDSGILSLFEAVFCRIRDAYGVNLAFQDASVVSRLLYGDGYSTSATDNRRANSDSEGGFSMFWIIVIIVVLVIVLGGRRRRYVRRNPGVRFIPVMRPRAPRPPRVPRPPMGAPRVGTPRANVGSRPSGGFFSGSSRPSVSRPSVSRPSVSRPSSAGRVTRGGGSSHGSGASRGR